MAETEFSLLGPLLVTCRGVGVPVAPGKQRALLAGLLLNANKTVSQDELAEILWGDALPPSARVTLHNYVKRLRQAVQVTGEARIRTSAGGYEICTSADELDIARFETLQHSANRAAADGVWDQAAEQLRAALSLWRGEPLADVPSEVLALREVPRLTEMRLQAVEARIEAELQLGLHAAVIAELKHLTFAHPLRERLHALLMIALYRDGQQAAALAAYQHVRRTLIDELGAEPGPAVSRIQQQILTSDPGLAGPEPLRSQVVSGVGPKEPGTGVRAFPVVPRQLPAAVRHFSGRAAELTALSTMSGHSDRQGRTLGITAIAGTAGVGKTALAVQWAHQVAEQFPDGQLYVNLRGYDPGEPMAAADALAGFLRAAGVPGQDIPAEPGERAALYRSLLAGRRMLLLLDNAGSADQIRPLLPGTPGCAVVITSRDPLAALVARDGALRLDLDLLSLEGAVELLRVLIGDRADNDARAVEALAQQCARLPLALRVAAELVVARPAAALGGFASELADQQRRLDMLEAGGDPQTAVRAVLSWSCRLLDADAARTFRLLGLQPGAEWDAYATAALAGVTIERARQLLDLLVRAYLVQPASGVSYGMHDLLKAYAAEEAIGHETEGDRHAALTRLFDYYLHTAAAAAVASNPGHRPLDAIPALSTPAPSLGDPAAARAWLDAHRAVLISVAEYTADYGWPSHSTRLATTIFRYLEYGAHYAETLAICGHARRGARNAGDLAAEAEAVNNATVVDLRQGRYDRAGGQLLEALALYEKAGDKVGQARVFGNLAIVCTQQGLYPQASDHYQQALRLYREVGDVAGEMLNLSNLGLIDLRQGRYQQAREHCRSALALGGPATGGANRAMALVNLGICELRMGRYQEAAGYLQQALDWSREAGFPAGEAVALTSFGELRRRQGDYDLARELHLQALDLCRRGGDQSGEAEALNSLGDVHRQAGEIGQANEQYQAALNLATSIGDEFEQTRALNGLGEAAIARGELDQARPLLEGALALAVSTGDQYERARALESLARTGDPASDAGQARGWLEQALAIYEDIGAAEASRIRRDASAVSA